MKRTLSMLLLMFFLLPFMPVNGFAGDRIKFSVTGNYLYPSDADFREIYGNGHFYPELKLGYKVSRIFYLWGGYGFFTADGTIPVLNYDAKTTQHFFSGGLGFITKISHRLMYSVEVGPFYVKYKEEALGDELSDSALGFRLDGGLLYRLGHSLLVEITLGYLSASDSIEGLDVKLGGFKTGIGLEILL